jgi:hypothetical protein
MLTNSVDNGYFEDVKQYFAEKYYFDKAVLNKKLHIITFKALKFVVWLQIFHLKLRCSQRFVTRNGSGCISALASLYLCICLLNYSTYTKTHIYYKVSFHS